jgi:hypothetical protein
MKRLVPQTKNPIVSSRYPRCASASRRLVADCLNAWVAPVTQTSAIASGPINTAIPASAISAPVYQPDEEAAPA